MRDYPPGRSDPAYWRSLEEREAGPHPRALGQAEFPPGASAPPGEVSRRGFLKLLGASAALAGLGACTDPPLEKILPYADQPPEVTPGIPRYYATSMVLDGLATGLLVESHAGRPVKVEGNPEHPASLGAAGVYEQASPLQLYDPDRGRAVLHRGEPASWGDLVDALGAGAGGSAPWGPRGEGLAILLEPTSSPLLISLLDRVRARIPAARIHFQDSPGADAALRGAALVYGRPLQTRYDLSRAQVLVSLDADFLGDGPFHLRYAHDFAERRRITSPTGTMNRLYAAEPVPSVTGAAADHRLRVRAGEVRGGAVAILQALAAQGVAAPGLPPAALAALDTSSAPPAVRAWAEAAARDLAQHRGAGLVIAGDRQPPEVHALAHLLNDATGNLGRTVLTTEPVLAGAGGPASGLGALAAAVRGGGVQALVILEGNPAYAAPADLDFAALLRRVPHSAYLGTYADETAAACEWYVPSLHYLESWGDARALDGTLSLVQPLIRPLHPASRAPGDLLALLAGQGGSSQYQLLRESWRGRAGVGDFEAFWDAALRRGFLLASEAAPVAAAPRWESATALLAGAAADRPGIELVFPLDPSVRDGRFANLSWLQELPDPLTKLTWDNAALLSPATAKRLGVESQDVVELRAGRRSVRAPALILPGQADDVVALRMGYGRAGGESLARGVGVNANLLRTAAEPYFVPGARVERVLDGGGSPVRYPLALTQDHWSLEGRPVVLHATLADYRRDPDFARRERGRSLSLYRPFVYKGEQWAMSIDLSLCTGCSACVVACQAENNVPVVGKEGVRNSREMHWLRIDRYFSGDPADPQVLMQPMLCQHCEKAPCEYVCPVNATTHSPDGLNEMTYNRCVGTRFCSNNCPYKVRRFNWFDYTSDKPETERMLMNPDVTVRSRGVMEKCSYCVQRIRRHQIDEQTGRNDPTVARLQTACQQSCPTRAIEFGSLGDPESAMVKMREEPRSYSVLHELGTEPRTRYLARITNPGPLAAETVPAPEATR
jgi:molybdopterin-containing oxidoreductase family iron-sulfur binding subunit